MKLYETPRPRSHDHALHEKPFGGVATHDDTTRFQSMKEEDEASVERHAASPPCF